jgi:hypothetical protein
MKTRLFLFVLLLIAIAPTLVVYGQAGPKKPRTIEDYRPISLRELSELQPVGVLREPSWKDSRVIVQKEIFPSRVKVVYEGTKRPLLDTKKYVIEDWANHYAGAPEFYTVPYDIEMMFVENGESHWLVVRKEFVAQFQQEFKKGDAIELFLIKLGSARDEDNKLVPVLLAEKFLKP